MTSKTFWQCKLKAIVATLNQWSSPEKSRKTLSSFHTRKDDGEAVRKQHTPHQPPLGECGTTPATTVARPEAQAFLYSIEFRTVACIQSPIRGQEEEYPRCSVPSPTRETRTGRVSMYFWVVEPKHLCVVTQIFSPKRLSGPVLSLSCFVATDWPEKNRVLN